MPILPTVFGILLSSCCFYINCRVQQKPNDRTKLEQKLVKLREEGELVAEKTRGRGVAVDQDSMLP